MSEVQDEYEDSDGQSVEIHQNNLHIEKVFEAFICPLTKELMQDPVVLENGQTFEHGAIKKWLSDCQDNGKKNLCPISLEELSSTYLTPNIALSNTIEEWKKRNEDARFNHADLVLSKANNEEDVFHALTYIQGVCTGKRYHKHYVHIRELIPRIVDLLSSSSSTKVRCQALKTIRIVVQEDAANKEFLATGTTIRTVVKFLIQDSTQERHEAVSLLSELSESKSLLEKIGDVNGAILILVGLASSKTEDVSTVQEAEKTLKNLENSEQFVFQMAENGRLQPLLKLLLEGSPETQLSMASYLGDLILSNDLKLLVAKNAGSSMVSLMKDGSKVEKAIAIKALNQISSHDASANLLIEMEILPPLIDDLLNIGNKELPMSLKETSANILLNIMTNSANSQSTTLIHHMKTLVSEEMIHNILHLISNTGPALECKLLKILVRLTSTSASAQSVAIAIRSAGAVANLVQFIDVPLKDLQKASLQLLHNISPYMTHDLTKFLLNSPAYLNKLVYVISETNVISEEQVAAIGILLELPDNDVKLTQYLLREKAFDLVVSQVRKILQGGALGNRVTPYLEGLSRVLLKFVCNNLDCCLPFIRDNNLAALFTDMLHLNGNDNAVIVSANALEKLSQTSKQFVRTDSSRKWGRKKTITSFCPVHCALCSMKDNFCLIEGRAVGRLVSCLDHDNKKVVVAALAALSTLLMDGLEIEQGVLALNKADGIEPIMQILENNRDDGVLQQKSVWAVERILRTGEIARTTSTNPSIALALRQAYQHGDTSTRYLAEKALKHIDKIPDFSVINKLF